MYIFQYKFYKHESIAASDEGKEENKTFDYHSCHDGMHSTERKFTNNSGMRFDFHSHAISNDDHTHDASGITDSGTYTDE